MTVTTFRKPSSFRRTLVMAVALCTLLVACGGAEETPEAAGDTVDDVATADGGTEAATDSGTERVTESPIGAAGDVERTSIRLAFQSPDFAQIANFKFVEGLQDAGIDVEFVDFEDDTTLMRALVAGEADYAAASAVASVIRLATEADEALKIVAADIAATDYVLVGQPEIDSLEDFATEDLQVGISVPGDVSDVLTRYMFDQAGLSADDVEFVQVGGTSARMTAILNDQLDAGPAHAAEGMTAAAEGGKKIIVRYAEYVPNFQQHSLFASEETLEANPNLTQLMVDTMVDATRWAAENKDEYIALAEQELEAPPPADIMDQAYDLFTEIGLFAVNGGMDPELLESTVAVEQAVGTLPEDVPAVETWADSSFVEDYLSRNGEQ